MGFLHRNALIGWTPSADETNAPPGALLRADNITLDEGVVSLRRGREKAFPTTLEGNAVDTVYSTDISGTRYIYGSAGNAIYVNGTKIVTTVAGSGDVAFGSGMGQVFAARSTTKKKYDGTTVRNWGLATPPAAPTLTAVDLISKTIADFDGSGPEFTATEGAITGTYPTGQDGTSNGALELTPATSGRGTIQYDFAATTNLLNFNGATGGDSDLFDFLFWDNAPDKTSKVTIAFDCNPDSSTTFEERFEYTFEGDPVTIALTRDEIIDSYRDAEASTPVSGYRPDEDPAEPSEPLSPSQEVLDNIDERREERSRLRGDKSYNPGWSHLTIPRARFERIGATTGTGWTTIAGVQITVLRTGGDQSTFRFDNLTVTAGQDGKVLVGEFRCRYRLAYNSGKYTELSAASPISDPITLEAQGINVTIPEATALAMDTQANEIWLYLYSSLLGAYYRLIQPLSLNRPRIRIHEFDDISDGSINVYDRLALATFGLVPGRRYTPGESSLVTVNTVDSTVTATETVYPTEATVSDVRSSSAVTPVGDPNISTSLDETSTDEDTTYVSIISTGGEEWFRCGVGALSETATAISSVQLTYRSRAETSNVTHTPFVYIGSTRYDGASNSPGTGYDTDSVTWAVSPATSAAWTPAELSGATFGVAQAAGANAGRVTLMNVTVSYSYGETVSGVSTRSVLSFSLITSEVELLLHNNKLDATDVIPPDNILGIAGPHQNRWFVLTSDGYVWISLRNNPSIYRPSFANRVADGVVESALWIKATAGGVYVGTTKDIYRFSGDFAELPDNTLQYDKREMNLGSPPVDSAVAVEGNNLVYHGAKDFRLFNGEGSTPLRGDMDPLYKGIAKHGVSPIDHTDGRFRCALSGGVFYYLAPETDQSRIFLNEFSPRARGLIYEQDRSRIATLGFPGFEESSAVIHGYDFNQQKWKRYRYPTAMLALAVDPDGNFLAGGTDGFIYKLDIGTDDSGTAIPVILWTPSDPDGLPLNRKEAFDLQMEMDTGGDTATVGVYLDESSALSYTATADGHLHHKRDISALSPYRRAQLRVTGDFREFKLWSYGLTYREFPQHRMFVDTGYIQTGTNDRVFVDRIRVCARSTSNLTVYVELDGSVVATETITVSSGVVKPYIVPLARGLHGRQPRIKVATTASAAATEAGFECWFVEVDLRRVGHQREITTKRIDFANTPDR